MSINNLNFSRDWTKPKDFPTLEENEEIVRQDMQFLHNETKEFLNSEVIPEVNKNREDIDANAEHLASVDITTSVHDEALADHEDRISSAEYTVARIQVEDVIRDQHLEEHDTHFNKTDIEVALLKQDAHTHGNKDVLDSIGAVTQTLGNSATKVPSEKAVSDALTQSGSMPGGGTTGQALVKKSGTAFDTEWRSLTADDIKDGVMPAERGGTGETTLRNSANALINALSTGTSAPKDDDYMITQYVGGGDTNTTYYRRKMSYLWTWIKGKADAVYAALSHEHSASDITSGALPAARGGTGQTNLSAALAALINNSTALAASGLATGDHIGLRDASDSSSRGKKTTLGDLMTFMENNKFPMTKLMEHTTTSDAATVNVSISSIDLTAYSEIILFVRFSTTTNNSLVSVRLNGQSGIYYKGSSSEDSMATFYNCNENKNGPGKCSIFVSNGQVYCRGGYNDTEKYVKAATLAPSAVTKLTFITASDVKIKSGSQLIIYGVK